MVRTGNEDSFVVAPELGLFAVADGMGGHNAGEVASRMAIDVLRDYLSRTAAGGEVLMGSSNPGFSEAANHLASGIRLANRVVYESAQSNPAWKSMGTTVVAALVRDDRLSIAHVGDSRAYLIRGGSILQLTEDHSMVAEQVRMGLLTREAAETSSRRNIITRALGFETPPDVDLCDLPLAADDRVLLCSDGLTTMVTDEVILATVQSSRDPDEACRRLVDLANAAGGRDNITVVTVAVKGGTLSGISRMFGWGR
jgi:protein phosphatase